MKLRNYYLTMSRMTPLQIAWRLRRLTLQHLWKRQRRPLPTYKLRNLIATEREPFGYPLPDCVRHSVISRAQALCAGEFTFLNQQVHFAYGLPDWTYTPDGDPLWTYNLHYFEYVYDLLWAYQLTRNSTYVQQLAALVDHWIDENPFWNHIAWNPYPLSRRIVVWATLLPHLRNCPDIAPIQLDRWGSSLCQQINFLADNLEYDVDNNHLITNARALIWAGLIMTEHRHAQRWRRKGAQIMEREAHRQILADGGHWERSVSYQMVVLQDYLEVTLLLAHCNEPVPPIFTTVVNRMFDFLRALIRPDGQLPIINDTVRKYPINSTELFSVGAAYLQRSDLKLPIEGSTNIYLLWLLGLEGHDIYKKLPPSLLPQDSIALIDSGYFVMRNTVGKTTSYLLFDCGPIGPAHSPAHAHADTLSFELVVGDQAMLIDPGVYEYKAGQWRNQFRSTQFHNTVTVDGLDQSVFWGNFRTAEVANAQLNSWHASTDRISVEGEHDGYKRLSGPVNHRRQIESCGQFTWKITDILDNLQETSHHYEWWYHLFHTASVIDVNTQSCSVNFPGGKVLSISIEGPNETEVSIKEGWISEQWKTLEPAPILHISHTSPAKQVKLVTTIRVI